MNESQGDIWRLPTVLFRRDRVFREAGGFLLEGGICGSCHRAGVSHELCWAAVILPFPLQMGSPASHTVPFGILAPSMQLHCFQLSYAGLAKMGIRCRVLVGGGCPHAHGPIAHEQWHPSWAGHCQAGEQWPCKARALSPAEMQNWMWHCPGFALFYLSARSPVGVSMQSDFSARQWWVTSGTHCRWGTACFRNYKRVHCLRNVGGIGMGPLWSESGCKFVISQWISFSIFVLNVQNNSAFPN